MLGTKVEIKMKKAEAGSWSKLFIPRQKVEQPKIIDKVEDKIEDQVDALDLDDLEYNAQNVTLSKEASGGRTQAEII